MGQVTIQLDRSQAETVADIVEDFREKLDEGHPMDPGDLAYYDALTDLLRDLLDQLGEDTETIERRTGRAW